MKVTSQHREWLSSGIGQTILAQLESDPGIPQTKSTISSWQTPPEPHVGNLQSQVFPSQAEYVIIGSGIAGCGVAKTLLEHPASDNCSVVVLEARGLCSGATGRNGGQLVKPYPGRFAQLADDFGVETAIKVFRLANRTLDAMHGLADSYDDELRKAASARRLTKVAVYMDEKSWQDARDHARVYEQHLPEERGKMTFVTKEELEKKWNVQGGHGAITFPAGVCWPYRLVTGVFRRLKDQYPDRLRIECHTPATTILYDSQSSATHPYLIVTPRGIIRATHIVHCTNGHTGHLLPHLRGKIWPMREAMSTQDPGDQFPDFSNTYSWAFLSNPFYKPQQGTVRLGWVYGLQHPHAEDARTGSEFWIGGEDRRPDEIISADDTIISTAGRQDLASMLRQVFTDRWVPYQPSVRHMWTGIVALTGDTLPFLGRLPSSVTGRPSTTSRGAEWIAGGWNQYGMTNGLTCGEALARIMLGEDAPEWLPHEYLITEERLQREKFAIDYQASDYLSWTGVGAALDEEVAAQGKADAMALSDLQAEP